MYVPFRIFSSRQHERETVTKLVNTSYRAAEYVGTIHIKVHDKPNGTSFTGIHTAVWDLYSVNSNLLHSTARSITGPCTIYDYIWIYASYSQGLIARCPSNTECSTINTHTNEEDTYRWHWSTFQHLLGGTNKRCIKNYKMKRELHIQGSRLGVLSIKTCRTTQV